MLRVFHPGVCSIRIYCPKIRTIRIVNPGVFTPFYGPVGAGPAYGCWAMDIEKPARAVPAFRIVPVLCYLLPSSGGKGSLSLLARMFRYLFLAAPS